MYADLVEKNLITNDEKTGVFGTEYPNPFPSTPPPFEGTIFFQLAGNKISKNVFLHNGFHGGPFTGDVTLASGANEIFLGTESQSKNNCVSGNVFTGATFPAKIQGTWGCQNGNNPEPRRWPTGLRIHRRGGRRSRDREKTRWTARSAATAVNAGPVPGGTEEPAVPVSSSSRQQAAQV